MQVDGDTAVVTHFTALFCYDECDLAIGAIASLQKQVEDGTAVVTTAITTGAHGAADKVCDQSIRLPLPDMAKWITPE